MNGPPRIDSGPIAVLSGGIGGAKLALGCARLMARPGDLTIIANTGDDFQHYGLHVSPDIDTLMYTLSGQVNRETGWGRAGESWHFMEAVAEFGGETWFQLGDRDLATHVLRTYMLNRGRALSAITRHLCERMNIRPRVLPMSDGFIRTQVRTTSGWIDFQRYFVEARCEPAVDRIRFAGCETARPSREALRALRDPSLAAILIAPSNPWLSIDPILAVPGLRQAIEQSSAPVIALSPIIAGKAIKGPTAKLMRELGHEPSAAGVAAHYKGLIDGFVLDERDRALARRIRVPVQCTDTYMQSLIDREKVARAMIEFAGSLREAHA